MPRSGTSWLSQIFDSHPDTKFKLSPLFSYAFKNAVNIESSKKEWLKFLDGIVSPGYPIFTSFLLSKRNSYF